jgi:hypothetical protein
VTSGNWHLVEARWYCNCDDIEQCRTEAYVSDIRILTTELEHLKGGDRHLLGQRSSSRSSQPPRDMNAPGLPQHLAGRAR